MAETSMTGSGGALLLQAMALPPTIKSMHCKNRLTRMPKS
jgi:hypothetical protein